VLPGSGYPWWQDYQPVSYKLDSTRRGTRSQFVAMVNSCHAAGVKVYVDSVINHMTGGSSGGTGSAGSSYTHYDHPGAGEPITSDEGHVELRVHVERRGPALTGRSFHTALPAGVYCDVFHGDYSSGSCSGPTYTVDSSGWFRADIAATDGLALHAAARIS
jgi:hypothetical protein